MTIDGASYAEWIRRFDTPGPAGMEAARAHANKLPRSPRIDVVMPVHDPPPGFLVEALRSVQCQVDADFSLNVVDDGSTSEEVRAALRSAARGDPRISVRRLDVNAGIAGATNAALEMGDGEFVAFLDHDDLLAPYTLLSVRDALSRRPDANVIYSDFDFLDATGARMNPFFKPDYDPDYHLGLNMVTHLSVYRRTLLEALGGLREGFYGSEDYDLSLRATERVPEHTILHLPHVLYHWRIVPGSFSHTRGSTVVDGARRAVQEHCERIGVPSTVGPSPRSLIWNRVRPTLAEPISVTLATWAPSREARREAFARVQERTDYPAEFATADPEASEEAAFRNAVVRKARTDIVAFVDARLVPRDAGWLREMASLFAHPRCVVVGARVLQANGAVEHSGLLLGMAGDADLLPVASAFAGVSDASANYFGRAELLHRVAAASGGALLFRRSALLEISGFDQSLADSVAIDVDACLRLRKEGGSVVLCPYAIFDARAPSAQRTDPSTAAILKERFGSAFGEDPYYNPNLSDTRPGFRLAFPPRVRFPWMLPAESSGDS